MATDLLILRDQIDAIDKQIVELYEKRMEVCKEVAEYKIETGKKVFDKVREAEKIEKVRSMASTEFNKYAVQELFEQIMSISRKMQYQLLAEHGCIGNLPFMASKNLYNKQASVVFQGAEGAYSQAAMNSASSACGSHS
jgi:chorismate mutase/prephenate dehydratase